MGEQMIVLTFEPKEERGSECHYWYNTLEQRVPRGVPPYMHFTIFQSTQYPKREMQGASVCSLDVDSGLGPRNVSVKQTWQNSIHLKISF